MAKIAFDIKFRPQIESGEYKVETRDGKPVRIVCWDRWSEDGESIVALINYGTYELTYCFQNTGKFMNSGKTSKDDLFIIIPEPELTEFEKVVASWLETAKDEPITNEMIVDAADNLMFCARQQIIKEAEEKATNEGYGIEDAVAFNEGFKTAKEIYSKAEVKKQKQAEWSDSVAKEMFIKALERAVEQTKKGYELTDCDKHSWWEDFKTCSGIKPTEWSEED